MSAAALYNGPEQQIPNHQDRAQAVEVEVRKLFAASLEAGQLACVGSGVIRGSKIVEVDGGLDYPYFDIGTPPSTIENDQTFTLSRQFQSIHDVDDYSSAAQPILRRFAMDWRQGSHGYVPPYNRKPVFPQAYDANAMARGEHGIRAGKPYVDQFRSGARGIEISRIEHGQLFPLGWVSDDRGLWVGREDFFQPSTQEIATNLETIERVLSALALSQPTEELAN